jgi:hypothetical protein
MTKQYYDDFSKLTLDKMAQEMENLTYLYHETKVPKKHYKEQLSKGYEELIEASVSRKSSQHHLHHPNCFTKRKSQTIL